MTSKHFHYNLSGGKNQLNQSHLERSVMQDLDGRETGGC